MTARAKKKAEGPLSEAAVMVLLKERFAAPEFAFMPHVRNGTGWSRRTTRTADALAMGLWPSRGLDLHGFEIKSDRRDWLREKEDPEKAEEIARFCDRWWVVTGAEGVVQPELDLFPPAWGLLVASGGKLRMVREASKLDAKPLDRAQLAAILRRAAECVVPRAEIEAELEQARKRGEEVGRKHAELGMERLRDELARVKGAVHAFQLASGVTVDTWHGAGRIGEAVQFVLQGGLEREAARLRGLHDTATSIVAALAERLAALPTTKTGTEG